MTIGQIARIIDAQAFKVVSATAAGEKKLRDRRARATEKATIIHAAMTGPHKPVTDKVQTLTAMQRRLNEYVANLFPPGSPIKWRTPNSFDQTGTVSDVVIIDCQLRIRVVDDVGHFASNIALTDVLRAAP
jgi:hypothetical protein